MMTKCNKCGSEMETLFTSTYCPKGCDTPPGTPNKNNDIYEYQPEFWPVEKVGSGALTIPGGRIPDRHIEGDEILVPFGGMEINGRLYQVPNCHCGQEPNLEIMSKMIITPGEPNREEPAFFHLYCPHCEINKRWGSTSSAQTAVETWTEALKRFWDFAMPRDHLRNSHGMQDMFPMETRTHAQSALLALHRIQSKPMWYGGATLQALRDDIYTAVEKRWPDVVAQVPQKYRDELTFEYLGHLKGYATEDHSVDADYIFYTRKMMDFEEGRFVVPQDQLINDYDFVDLPGHTDQEHILYRVSDGRFVISHRLVPPDFHVNNSAEGSKE